MTPALVTSQMSRIRYVNLVTRVATTLIQLFKHLANKQRDVCCNMTFESRETYSKCHSMFL